MTKHLTTLGSIGTETGTAYDPKQKKNVTGRLYAIAVYTDGVRREMYFSKSDAMQIYHSIQSCWKEHFNQK